MSDDVLTRPPARHATYRGNVEHMVGQPVGPTTLGDYLTAVDAAYNPVTDTTRVGFAFGLPPQGADTPWSRWLAGAR